MPTADREGLREALTAAERFQRLSVAVTQWTWDPSQHEVTLRLPRESEYGASRELMQAARDLSKAEPLAETLAQADTAAQAVAENDRLRAGLANGTGPCAYCNLPREDWSKCGSGFPGCARADDAMLCPHVGAELETADKLATALAEVARLSAEVEARDKALILLLPFVDFAAGEGQEIVPDPDDATQDMDAAALCEAAAKALGFEMGDPDYVALLAAGREAIRALAAGQDKEGGKP